MDDRLTGVRRKISNLPLMDDCKMGFICLVSNIELSDKKIKTFLNIKIDKVAIGFLYRLLVSSAFKYGVPKVYIDKCINSKDNYNISKTLTSPIGREVSNQRKSEMRREFSDLMTATLGLIKQKNTRKEKISKVLEKIADKNN